MKTKTKRHLFCLISYFFALFVLPISIVVGAFDDMKTFKKADADTEYTLVGNILNNGDDWNETPRSGAWKLTQAQDGSEYYIKNFYMIAHDYSDFRIITWGAWTDDYGWNQVVNNEPGFTIGGDHNNIHITKTGYYDIRLYDNKSKIEIKYSELTLVGNIENNNDWNETPQIGKWKFQKNGDSGFKLLNVYMVTHSDSNFRILPWGDTTWQKDLGWKQLNYSGVSTNEPSFTSVGSDNNIHITETGYYNIYLNYSTDKKDWYIELYYDQDSTTVLECQIHVNNKKIEDLSDPRGFDFDFVYDDNITSKYSALGSNKRLVVHNHKKFYLKEPTIPTGYTLHHYNIGYTDHTDQYTGSQYGSSYYKNAWKQPDDSIRNYLNLYYQTITYSISYTLNGGTVETSNPSSYTIEKSSFTLNNPTKTGYIFAGWSGTGITGTSTSVTISKGSTGNRSYTANWTANTYTVHYNGNKPDGASGTVTGLPSDDTWTYDQNATLGSAPSLTGYRFDGWYKEAACTNKAGNADETLTKPNYRSAAGTYNLYAKWIELESLSFYLDASTIDFGNETPWFGYNESGDVPDGASGNWSAMSRISHSYEGVTLNFWTITINNVYTGDNLKLRINNTSVAHWDTGSFAYNSSYNTFWSNSSSTPNMYLGNGSVHEIIKYQILGDGDPVQQGDPSFLLDGTGYYLSHTDHFGYSFSKWNDSPDGTGTQYNDNDFAFFHSDTNIYAFFTETSNSIVFWEKTTHTHVYVWYNDGSDHPLVDWPGYDAWQNTITIDGTEYLYYEFNSQYDKVIFNDGNGGSGHQTGNLNVSDGAGQYYDISSSQWKQLSIGLTVLDKGGAAYSGKASPKPGSSFSYNETYDLDDGVKDGYKFNGWHLRSDCSDPAIEQLSAFFYLDAVTIYADWESGEAAAIEFATNFNTAIGGICTSYNTNTKASFLTNWNNTQEAAYNALEEYQQYWLDKSHLSSNVNVTAMVTKYDYVLSKYGYGTGASNLHDFLGRTPAVYSSIKTFTPFELITGNDGENNVSTVVIIIASSIALLSITALSVLLVKKKHEENN